MSIMSTISCLLSLSTISLVRAGINKPYGEWLCDYCSMGKYFISAVVSSQLENILQ